MGYFRGFLAALVLVVLTAAVAIWSGAYNVAASDPHAGPVAWALEQTMKRSVERRANDIESPPSFSAEQVRQGSGEFDEMCVRCHGAPGVEHEGWAEGLRPEPPDLAQAAAHWKPAELFWIVKHGIRMTGMPAFGASHDDATLWSVVAFLRQLPSMKPEDYAAMRRDVPAEHDEASEAHETHEADKAGEASRARDGADAARARR
jgi:mono/diheme cytochrome c family protein